MLKQNKGITLIALIITIIIMMILVAVSVTVALNGGLFDTAKKAGSQTQLKAEEELLLSAVVGAIGTDAKVDLGKLQLPDGFKVVGDKMYESPSGNAFLIGENGEIKNISRENDTNGVIEVAYEELTEELKTAMDEGKITKVLKEVKYGIEMQAVIPAGFNVSTKNGENTISGGLVISDADGNEFVWVPCTIDENDISGLTIYKKDTQYNDGTIASMQKAYTNYNDWKDDGVNSESVSKYKGFYVGRYEAGIPSSAPFFVNTDGAEYITEGRNTTEYIPVSKPNNISWNCISQRNAKTVSKNMYSDSTSVESSLIDSYAWCTILNWMESKNSGIALDSTEYGNYPNNAISLNNGLYVESIYDYTSATWISMKSKYKKGSIEIPVRSTEGETSLYEIATGSTDDTKVLNIYDMAGNVQEWTTEYGYHDNESYGVTYAVNRGGDYRNCLPISWCDGYGWNGYSADNLGFRVVLYIK